VVIAVAVADTALAVAVAVATPLGTGVAVAVAVATVAATANEQSQTTRPQPTQARPSLFTLQLSSVNTGTSAVVAAEPVTTAHICRCRCVVADFALALDIIGDQRQSHLLMPQLSRLPSRSQSQLDAVVDMVQQESISAYKRVEATAYLPDSVSTCPCDSGSKNRCISISANLASCIAHYKSQIAD
jgi:hypothetical protein